MYGSYHNLHVSLCIITYRMTNKLEDARYQAKKSTNCMVYIIFTCFNLIKYGKDEYVDHLLDGLQHSLL